MSQQNVGISYIVEQLIQQSKRLRVGHCVAYFPEQFRDVLELPSWQAKWRVGASRVHVD